MSSASDLLALRSELARMQGPGLAKTDISRRGRAEERAARAFRRALESSGLSQRAAARRLGVCERLVRDYLSGARILPAWAALALPHSGQVAFLAACAEDVPPESAEIDEEGPQSRTGTEG